MPVDNDHDPLDRWLGEQVRPLPPPPGTFELITRRARRRKVRKALISVASAAAVAAAVGIAVPVGMSLNVGPPSANGQVAAGERPASSAAQSSLSSRADQTAGSTTAPATSPAANATTGKAATGYLPPNFTPVSVTWDSLSTGWVMGPAGTPGQCANANPDICTSIARTDDGGQTWHGLPAPDTISPGGSTGVTGLRFLNASDGWAFGPELWATSDGGESWHKVDTGGAAVTDLETSNGSAFALFGDCPSTGATLTGCTSYTLMTAAAGSDQWTRVAGVPAGLTAGRGAAGSAVLTLAGPTSATVATGYLVAPDGTLYAGPLDGGTWHQAGTLPCKPGSAAAGGLPSQLWLTPAGPASSGADRLGLVCTGTGAGSVAYLSANGGASWTKQTAPGTAHLGQPESLTALNDGTLILATETSSGAAGGIYVLSPGASQWRRSTLSDPSEAAHGFSYVGMTSTTQGVALSGGTVHAVWTTTDGGGTWQLQPIKS
jgi:hypothetical protein